MQPHKSQVCSDMADCLRPHVGSPDRNLIWPPSVILVLTFCLLSHDMEIDTYLKARKEECAFYKHGTWPCASLIQTCSCFSTGRTVIFKAGDKPSRTVVPCKVI